MDKFKPKIINYILGPLIPVIITMTMLYYLANNVVWEKVITTSIGLYVLFLFISLMIWLNNKQNYKSIQLKVENSFTLTYKSSDGEKLTARVWPDRNYVGVSRDGGMEVYSLFLLTEELRESGNYEFIHVPTNDILLISQNK